MQWVVGKVMKAVDGSNKEVWQLGVGCWWRWAAPIHMEVEQKVN